MSDKEQRIRVRAYAIWEGEGRHDGQAEEHWRQAELEIEQALRSAEAQAAEAPEQRIRTARTAGISVRNEPSGALPSEGGIGRSPARTRVGGVQRRSPP